MSANERSVDAKISASTAERSRHVSRWDLDKTYLRTEFHTMRDLVRTALERADEKRTNPGASTLLRELARAGVVIHILSGSPEQMRRRLEAKLRLDGIRWDAFTLKPNLKNVLRLRFRAVKDQLGYKLPALLAARFSGGEVLNGARETLFGDDAEADAFVYSLYADILAGRASEALVQSICERARIYEDVIDETLRWVRFVKPTPVVERILIHLEQQTPPDDFDVYGSRVVPFYNYLQAAFIVFEDGRIPPESVLDVARELVTQHRFDGDSLVRSYADLGRRGHLAGTSIDALASAFPGWDARTAGPSREHVRLMVESLPAAAEKARATHRPDTGEVTDYLKLVERHNPRRRK